MRLPMCVVDISNVDGCCMLTSVTIKNSMLLILDDEFLLRCCCLLMNNGNDSRCVRLFGDVSMLMTAMLMLLLMTYC